MTFPSEAEATVSLQDYVDILQEREVYGQALDLQQIAARDALKGDRRTQGFAELDTIIASAGDALTEDAVADFLTSRIADFADAVGIPSRGFDSDMVELRKYWVDQGDTFNSRAPTYGTPAAGGGNVGDGVPLRITVGPDGENLEGIWAEAKALKIVGDQRVGGGTRHSELWRIDGAPVRDVIAESGSGLLIEDFKTFNPNDSTALLRNPSFSQYTGTAPTTGSPSTPTTTTDVTGWILSSTAAFRVDVDTVHDSMEGDTTPYSLQFVADGSLSQIIENNTGGDLEEFVPYPLEIEVYRKDAATGNFTITMGAVSQVFTVGSLTDNSWNTVKLDLDSDLYYKNFQEDLLDVVFTVDTLATGTIFIDSIRWGPATRVGGAWLRIPAGATPFRLGDTFGYTDSVSATRGEMVYWLVKRSGISRRLGYAYSVPTNNAGAETIGDHA